MRSTLAPARDRTQRDDVAVLLAIAALRADLAAVAARVREVEARLAPHGPRDHADMALLRVLAAVSDGLPFTAKGLWRRRAVDQRLADALTDCDLDNPRQTGKLLHRLTGRPVDGWRLQRVGTNRDGAVLRVCRE